MKNIKFVNLPAQFNSLGEEIPKKISEVLQSGDYILGNELKRFEQDFANYCKCRNAIGVGNGTDALFLAMKALDIGHGDEVITTPNSFVATAGAIVASGAKPVFVDVRDDFNINPHKIKEAITKKTKAIIPVHLTGRPADMKTILDTANQHEILVIEDAAQAVGALYNNQRTGSFGIAGCFSFHPLKTLNAYGDGGAITTNNIDLYERLIKIRNHGLKNRDECDFFGYNSRLDNIQAAILNIKLKYLDNWNKRIREIAKLYKENLQDIVKVPIDRSGEESVYHTFIILCEKRDELQQYLLGQGIETKVHYPTPIHLQQAASSLGYKQGDFPQAEMQAKKILSLPIYPELTEDEVKTVCNKIRTFYESGNV